MRKALMILAAVLLLLVSAALAEAEEKALTVMVYLTGSNLESATGLATSDVREMLRSGFDRERVNVVLFTGGSTRWVSGFPTDATGLYTLDRTARPTETDRFPLMNMGDPETLAFFLSTCQDRFPAENYILILWDHGGGPLLGVCSDRLHDGDTLSLAELRQALADSGIAKEKKLRLIGFDACLMSTLEVATVCAPYADYMVASQELEPGKGWDYGFLRDIADDADGAQTGRRIIDCYFEGAEREIRKGSPVTLACIDLNRIDALNRAIGPLFRGLSENLTARNYARYSISRQASASVARSSGREYDLVDLRSLLQHYGEFSDADTSAALAALDAAVVSQRSTVEVLNGLTVYFPFYNKADYSGGWGDRYGEISASGSYADWIRSFGAILTGETLTNWRIAEMEQEEGEPDVFTLYLTRPQQENFVSAELVVLTWYPGYGYLLTNRYGDIAPDRHGMLTATVDHQCLYPIGQEGEILGPEVPFREVDGFYTLRAQVHRSFLIYEEDNIRWVDIRLKENPESGLLEIVDAHYETDDDFPGRSDVDFDQWDSLAFVIHPVTPLRDEEGLLLPYDQWENPDGRWLMCSVSLNRLTGFGFRSDTANAAQRFACFQILDVQGRTAVSELMPIVNPNVTAFDAEETLVDSEMLGITLNRVQINRTDVDRGITFSMIMENRSDRSMMVSIQNVLFNGLTVAKYADGSLGANTRLDPGETKPVSWTLQAKSLRFTGLQSVSDICLSFDVYLPPEPDAQQAVSDDSSDAQNEYLFDTGFTMALDVSDLVSALPDAPLFTAEAEGLRLDAYSWTVEPDGSLVFHVRLQNRSGLTVTDFPTIFGSINGFCFGSRATLCDASGSSFSRCEDGRDWYGQLRFEAGPTFDLELVEKSRMYADLVTVMHHVDTLRSQSDDLFRDYGIREVRAVTLYLSLEPEETFFFERPIVPLTFRFDEPLDYAATRGQEIPPVPDFPLVAEAPAYRVRLAAVRVSEERVTAILYWDNLSEEPTEFVSFPVPGTDTNVDIAQCDLTCIMPGETARITLGYGLDADALPLSEITLPFARYDPAVFGTVTDSLFTVRFDPPVSGPCMRTEGFTVLPAAEEP